MKVFQLVYILNLFYYNQEEDNFNLLVPKFPKKIKLLHLEMFLFKSLVVKIQNVKIELFEL